MYQIILCAADHGVAAENVSSFPQSVTKTMVRNYLYYKGAALNAFADFLGAKVTVADIGMKEPFDHKDLVDFSIRKGTNNIRKTAAMTREEATKAIEAGRKLAKTAVGKGARYILPAEMGIANTTSAAAMSGALLNLPAEKVTGRGTNISNDKLKHKINIVREAITVNKYDNSDALDILSKLGGFEFAAIAGMVLEAKEHNVKIILDGLNTTLSALIATRIDHNAKNILIPSHLAGEAAHIYLLKELGLTPAMDLDFHLGEACGSSILAKCMEMPLKDVSANNNCNFVVPENITNIQREKAMEQIKERFLNLSMPHHALGALEEIGAILAYNLGTINIKENIPLNKNWLNEIGINGENYLINKKRLPHLTEVLTRATLFILNRMKTFEEAGIV